MTHIVSRFLPLATLLWFVALSTPATLVAQALVPEQGALPWSMFRFNPQRTGQSDLLGPAHPDLKWTIELEGLAFSSPVTAPDGSVYVSTERRVYALAPDGSVRWTYTFDAPSSSNAITFDAIVSTPAIDPTRQTLYIGTLSQQIIALNTANGSERWVADTAGEVFSSPAVGPDGTVYAGSVGGRLYALRPQDGVARWVYPTAGDIFASAALNPGTALYVGDAGGTLYAVNPATGGTLWTFATNSEFVASPVVGANGVVYAASFDGDLYAIQPNGTSAWASPFDTDGDLVASPALRTDGTIYVATFSGTLYAVNPNGTAKWSTPLSFPGTQITSSVAIDASGLLYFGTLDGTVYAVEDLGASGAVRWSYAAGRPVWSSPAIGDDQTLLFPTAGSLPVNGRLYAMGAAAFTITVTPNPPVAGQDLQVDIRNAGTNTAATGTLYYRRAGETAFEFTTFGPMATVPGTFVTEQGIQYYAAASNGERTFPAFQPEIHPATLQVQFAALDAPLSLDPRTYRMISVPLLLESPALLANFEDDFGPYAPQSWRILRWNGSQYLEPPALTTGLTPGTAFFLVTRSGGPFTVSGGTSVDTSQPYPIPLDPGWNQIGNPFGFPVAWASVIRDPSLVSAIAYYDGTEMIQDPAVVDSLAPWEGYFVLNQAAQPVTIEVDPSATAPAGKHDRAGSHPIADAGYILRLNASLPGTPLRDTQNWLGFHPDATASVDPLDIPEAPPFGDHIRLSIADDGTLFAGHFVPAGAGYTWDLELRLSAEAPTAGKAVVTIEPSGNRPEGMRTYVLDDDLGGALPVDDDRFEIPLSGAHPVRRLRLVVGTAPYADQVREGLSSSLLPFALLPNFPNPFRTQTELTYRLDTSDRVELTIFNLLGQNVRTLVQTDQEPGTYRVTWDGRDRSGLALASGLYVVRLRAGARSASCTLTLLR